MKKSIILSFFLIAVTLSCNDPFYEYKLIDFVFFVIEVPSNWEKYTLVGYDTKVGGITDGIDSLNYDYGWPAYDLSNESTDTHLRIVTLIDGYDASIVKPLIKGEGLIGVSIQVEGVNSFTMTGYSLNESIILRMFDSIKFD